MKRSVLFLRTLVALLMVASGLAMGVGPASAQPQFAGESDVVASLNSLDRCDVADFGDTKMMDPSEPYASYPGVAVGESDVVALAQTIPAGRILVSGTLFDEIHFDDQFDFDTTLSQFGEKLRVRFLGADGGVVGETVATPDLPDLSPVYSFALPSIDLTGDAVSIQLVHAGDGTSANSVYAQCINIDSVSPDADPSSLIRPAVCPLDAPGLDPTKYACGYFAVPEERSDPNSRLINIAFAILPGDGSQPDPVFYLEGGPGGAPMAFADFIVEAGLGQAAAGRDMVFVDIRGTGYSQPNLVCPFSEELFFEQPELFEEVGAFTKFCADTLRAEGTNLSAYTTIEGSADIAALHSALGYTEYNLFGGSYGTNVGLTIMRDNPEGVRSVVLDSVFPPVVNPLVDQGIGVIKMLDAIVERCESDADCYASHPDLQAKIIAAFDNVAAEPLILTGPEADFVAGGELFIDEIGLFQIISNGLGQETLPAIIDALAHPDPQVREERVRTILRIDILTLIGEALAELEGPPPGSEVPLPDELPEDLPEELPEEPIDEPLDGPDLATALAGGALSAEDISLVAAIRRSEALTRPQIDSHWGIPGPGSAFSDGFFLTVICAEEEPFIGKGGATEPSTENWTGAIVEIANGTAFPVAPGSLDVIKVDCAVLDLDPEDPIVTEPVVSDIPAMVLLTDVDVQTFPEWSELTAETLSNSFLFEFPNLSHVVALSNPCPASMVADFYGSPMAEPDSSCIDGLPLIDYSGEIPVDPGPIDDIIAEFEALIEELFSEEPVGPGGAPIDPSDIPTDEDGNILDENGELVLDENGDPVNIVDVFPELADPPAEGEAPAEEPAMVEDADSIQEIMQASDYDNVTDAAILRLYQAIFGRYPDVTGAKYWIDISDQGFDVLQIAGYMSGSKEWENMYGDATNEEFVAKVYTNVLGRDYDQSGYDYWLEVLSSAPGEVSRHEVVYYVTANDEFTRAYPFQS